MCLPRSNMLINRFRLRVSKLVLLFKLFCINLNDLALWKHDYVTITERHLTVVLRLLCFYSTCLHWTLWL